MMTTQQAILTKILNCGYCDLDLLEDIQYDLDEIIDDCMENECLSFNEILHGVFWMGASDLQNAFDENRYEIRCAILEALKNEKEEFIDNGEMTQEELEDCEEHKQLVSDLELIDNYMLNPKDDLDYFMNYQDTHVYMKHIDFYKRWMKEDIDNIEYHMGRSFKDKNW